MNNQQLTNVLKAGGKVGKKVLIEGSKMVLTTGFVVATERLFTKGIGGVKDLTVNNLLGMKEEPEVIEVVLEDDLETEETEDKPETEEEA